MSLTDQRRSRPSGRRATMASKARGYTLVALMIGLTVMSILIASVLPLASAERQRDREAELIFRGRQYAEGIRTYRRRYGRYPTSLKEMLETRPRTLRKLWKDPITDTDAWGLITFGAGSPLNPIKRDTGLSGSGRPPVPSPTPSPTPTAGMFGDKPPGAGVGPNGQPIGPISGVHSLSKKKGYRLWDGRENYDEWRFTEASLTPQGESGTSQGGVGFGGPAGNGIVTPKK